MIKETFPMATLHVANIIRRKSTQYDETITQINDFLKQFCRRNIINFMKYEVDRSFLMDEKHLNKSGFYILLNAVKYVLLGVVPTFIRKGRAGNNRYNRYGSGQWRGGGQGNRNGNG